MKKCETTPTNSKRKKRFWVNTSVSELFCIQFLETSFFGGGGPFDCARGELSTINSDSDFMTKIRFAYFICEIACS